MITLAEAEQRVRGKVCPRCLHTTLTAVLHLSEGKECLCTARCRHCGYEFPVEDTWLDTLEEAWAHVAEGLKYARCPGCETPHFTFEFRCDLGDGYCHFLAECLTCHRIFLVEDHHTHVRLLPWGQQAAPAWAGLTSS